MRVQENLRSPHEYRANGTISAIVQEFLAATIGGYRAFIKSPAQQTPQRPASAVARLSISKLRSRMSSHSLDSEDAASDRSAHDGTVQPEYMDDRVIQGTNGYRFYHSAFVQSFRSRASRDFAAALIHTQLWQVHCRARSVVFASCRHLSRLHAADFMRT